MPAATANFTVTVSVEPEKSLSGWPGDSLAGLVIKADDERRYTLCVAYPANKPDAAVARDGFRDFASKGAVEKAAWSYMEKYRDVGLWHEDGTEGAGRTVESFLWPDGAPDWHVTAADGSEQVVKSGDWLIGIRWSETTWPLVKSGRIRGVSMQGKATRRKASAESAATLRN